MKLKKALLPLIFLFTLSSCDQENTQRNQHSSINVKVFETQPLIYTVRLTLPARTIASQTAEIRPQVSGIILNREFEESSNVKAGQSLYQIDPAIYEAQYNSALASLASSESKAEIAHLTLKRYAGLLKKKSISQQDYDNANAQAKQADAAVAIAKANLHTAKVNLNYTKVYSPIDGYIGKSNVTEGALVSANQTTALALVQKIDPIYVDMTFAASKYEEYEQNKNHLLIPDNKVDIYFNENTKYEHEGKIKFLDKTVNETTGTVTLRAEFANPDAKILPGMFIKPKWTLGKIENAILVPQKGITSNTQGNYTAIVAVPLPEDNTKYYVESRDNIQVYSGITGYWIVTDGIKAGEKVLISGLLNLSGKRLNDPQNKVMVNILNLEKPETLSQDELDTLIDNNLK